MAQHPDHQTLQPEPGHASPTTEAHRAEAPHTVRCYVITVSDTRSMQDDAGGALIEQLLEEAGHTVVGRRIVRDEVHAIVDGVSVASEGMDDPEAIIVTGGSGIGGRDVSPEAIRPLLSKEMPGFGEIFRVLSFQEIGAAAMLSRAFAGVMVRTLVFVLPGSPNAIRLGMDRLILPELGHLVREVRPERRNIH